jgi:hypothetical protein
LFELYFVGLFWVGITPEQLVAYLSEAAGQDVGRLFKRLDGFPENFR